MEGTILKEVLLHGARIDRDTTKLRTADWGGKMMLGDELSEDWIGGMHSYGVLKRWYQHNGDHDVAGKFHYREWECKRKLAQQDGGWGEVVLLWLSRMLYGYGEHPWRVVRAGAAVIAFFALAFYLPYLVPQGTPLCLLSADCWKLYASYLGQSLYFSGVSFTALGYGIPETMPNGWTRYLGVVESLVGISLIALFLVTFTRKMTR